MDFTEDELRKFMAMLYRDAAKSPDRSTQTAACIIHPSWPERTLFLCKNNNHFPPGYDPNDDAKHEKPLKYSLIVHSERAAIYLSAANGLATVGRTMVACWAPCAQCAQAIVESGIKTLVVHADRMRQTPERWKADVDLGLEILRRAGVELFELEGPVNAGVSILFDGQRIEV